MTAAQAVRGGSFADILAKQRGPALAAPPRVVELPLEAWVAGLTDRPAAATPIGLRLPSELETEAAEEAALRSVAQRPGELDDRVAAYNNALIHELVARACTLAMDVTNAFFDMGAHSVKRRLTTNGIQRLWQELEALRASSDPSTPKAGDDEFAHLIALWGRDAWHQGLPAVEATRIRRLLEHCRQVMAEGEERLEHAGIAVPPQPVAAPQQDAAQDAPGTPSAPPVALPGGQVGAVLAGLQRRGKPATEG